MNIWGKFSLDIATCVIIALFLTTFSASISSGRTPATLLSDNPWSEFKTPSTGPLHSAGFYSNGCISGAKALPLEGLGYQVMRPSRNRFYGHDEAIEFVQSFSEKVKFSGSGILIGDIGQPRGGPMPSGHASHQVGLDIDVWFWNHPEQNIRSLTFDERENLPMISMLDSNGNIDENKFKAEQILKLKFASLDSHVQRIFVNPAIKLYLCAHLQGQELEWLHKLRPWPGHDEHFHARLYCPDSSPECVPQEPVPEGDGCEEARTAATQGLKKSSEMVEPTLFEKLFVKPAAQAKLCEQLVKEAEPKF